MHRKQWLLVLLSAFILASNVAHARNTCAEIFDRVEQVDADHYVDQRGRLRADPSLIESIGTTEATRGMLHALLDFAEKHHLDERVVEVGPPNRRLKRLVVALDVSNRELVRDYMATFNLDQPIDSAQDRTLSLEFSKEIEDIENGYVFSTLRSGGVMGTREGLWRFGRTSTDQTADWFVDHYDDPRTHIVGFAHLIPITRAEADNSNHFLFHPDDRAPCKRSDNCVAWLPSMELTGTTEKLPYDERVTLFDELGVSRSMAHFEVARRVAHAANARHVAMVAYYRDPQGLKNFRDPNFRILPPEPKQPFDAIIRNFVRPQDTPALIAMKAIPDGAKVFFPIAAGASPDGMSALIDRAAELPHGVDVHVQVNGISEATFRRGVATPDGKFRLHVGFLGANLRLLNREGKVNVIPAYLSDFARHVGNPNMTEFHYDAMVVRVSPPDSQGRYSLGPNNDMIKTILALRPGIKVIAEVNPNIPFTIGDNFLTEKDITAKFESRTELASPASMPIDDIEHRIGDHLASLIGDGSTVQIGIGGTFAGLPDAMIRHGRRGIRFDTEMASDEMMRMVDSGVAEGIRTGFFFGSTRLYNWIAHNPKVDVVPTLVANDSNRLSQTKGFVAVNTALQINLRGDVNAEIGPQGRVSSPGGQVEFMWAGMHAPNGKAIIALRSKLKFKPISAIVLDNYAGNVTTPNQMVTHVVTEYGVAELAGKSEAQRALALIRIAHPDFRSQLAQQALERGLINAAQRSEFP